MDALDRSCRRAMRYGHIKAAVGYALSALGEDAPPDPLLYTLAKDALRKALDRCNTEDAADDADMAAERKALFGAAS